MSSITTIKLTNDNEHIYFDCSNEFTSENIKHGQEITFEFAKKNIRIDINDEDELCFSLDKGSEIFEYFYKLFNGIK